MQHIESEQLIDQRVIATVQSKHPVASGFGEVARYDNAPAHTKPPTAIKK